MRRLSLLVVTLAFAAPAAAQTSGSEERHDLGFGVALGLNPSPQSICNRGGDLVSCSTLLPAWAFRVQVTHAVTTSLSASLVAGLGTDLDASERVSSDGGRGEDGRQFFDLLVRVRHDLGRENGAWAALEAGAAMARDWAADFAADGHRTSHRATVQFAPAAGAIVGLVLLRESAFALDLELGMRVTAFSDPPPPPLSATGSPIVPGGASEYGLRQWIWMGLGGRFWR